MKKIIYLWLGASLLIGACQSEKESEEQEIVVENTDTIPKRKKIPEARVDAPIDTVNVQDIIDDYTIEIEVRKGRKSEVAAVPAKYVKDSIYVFLQEGFNDDEIYFYNPDGIIYQERKSSPDMIVLPKHPGRQLGIRVNSGKTSMTYADPELNFVIVDHTGDMVKMTFTNVNPY